MMWLQTDWVGVFWLFVTMAAITTGIIVLFLILLGVSALADFVDRR